VRKVSIKEAPSKAAGPTRARIASFRRTVLDHYRARGRDLPWRRTRDPYKILVSEVMLQQTQVSRVLNKWEQFVDTFPDFASLGAASLVDILTVWRGLGYNRRALYLGRTACIVTEQYGGALPDRPDELVKLPGIGPNTAGAIVAFAFNRPVVFIETNIRTAFIHHFFSDETKVPDSRIIPLIETTMVRDNPRVWYWALMDYGTMLKEEVENPGRKSAHYLKQSPFRGSNREIRGAILRLLLTADRTEGGTSLTETEIVGSLPMEAGRVRETLFRLIAEGLVIGERGRYRIT
jgi:A/G-specific adenine glycosylase